MHAFIDENIFSKSLAKAFESTSVFVAPISIKADAIGSYSSVAIDAKNTSIAAHVFGDIRPTIPVEKISALSLIGGRLSAGSFT